jgi:hypothetical protein
LYTTVQYATTDADMEEFEIIDYVTLSVRTVGTVYGAYRWWMVCSDEASWFRGDAIGNTNLGKLIGGAAVTDIDGAAGYSPLYDTFTLLAFLGNGWDAKNAYKNYGWDSFDFTLQATQGLSRLLMFLDKVAKLNIVTPQKPWTRFLKVA